MSALWTQVTLGSLCTMVKGTSPTLKTMSGPYPLVVTAEFRRSADSWQIEGPAVCIPLVSSTGHGDAAIHRVHYQEGKFALANLLVALMPKDSTVCNAKFLYYLLTAQKDTLLVPLMQGTANVSLKDKDIAKVEILLPPLAKQQQIVARIEELAAKIEEAQRLRRQAVEEAEALCRSIIFKDPNAVLTPMCELVRQKGHDVQVKADQTYHFAGVYCFGRGVFRGQKKSGIDFAYKQLGQLKAGNFVYPKLMAWEGAFGVVPQECDGLFVSPEFPIFEVLENRVLPETLDVYFRAPAVWPQVAGESTGTNVRRRRLNPKDFLAYKIPLPSMEKQLQLRQVMQQVDGLKRLQAETTAELDAMLPSILDKAFQGELTK